MKYSQATTTKKKGKRKKSEKFVFFQLRRGKEAKDGWVASSTRERVRRKARKRKGDGSFDSINTLVKIQDRMREKQRGRERKRDRKKERHSTPPRTKINPYRLNIRSRINRGRKAAVFRV